MTFFGFLKRCLQGSSEPYVPSLCDLSAGLPTSIFHGPLAFDTDGFSSVFSPDSYLEEADNLKLHGR